MNQVELNQGEIKIQFEDHIKGKVSLKELGVNDTKLEGGLLRLVFEFGAIKGEHFYAVPTIELAYVEEMAETHWQCDYNDETILDKMDHHGKSTVVLLNRKKLNELEHRHINELILHGEFPQPATIIPEESWVHFF